MNKKLILVGCGVIATGMLLRMALVDTYYRLTPDWSWEAEFVGDAAIASETGNLPQARSATAHLKRLKVTSWTPERAVVVEEDTWKDPQSGEILSQRSLSWDLDPESGRHLASDRYPEAKELFYLFPLDAERRDYTFYDDLFSPYTVRYDRQDAYGGLTVYIYQFFGDLDVTRAYLEIGRPSVISPPAGQKIVSYGFLNELWVEPVSGEIIKIRQSAEGENFVDIKTGDRHRLIQMWSGTTTQASADRLVQQAKDLIANRVDASTWLATGIMVVGVVLVVLGLAGKGSEEASD